LARASRPTSDPTAPSWRYGPAVIETAAGLLARVGISLDPSKADTPVDAKDRPTLGFLETQARREQAFRPIRARYGSSDEDPAFAAAAATSLRIRHGAKTLDPSIAFSIAALGFVEGTKTAPDPSRWEHVP
jgi:hypothetical protein